MKMFLYLIYIIIVYFLCILDYESFEMLILIPENVLFGDVVLVITLLIVTFKFAYELYKLIGEYDN